MTRAEITEAIREAVEAATKPLRERVEALERHVLRGAPRPPIPAYDAPKGDTPR